MPKIPAPWRRRWRHRPKTPEPSQQSGLLENRAPTPQKRKTNRVQLCKKNPCLELRACVEVPFPATSVRPARMPPASRPTSVSIAPTPPSARECSSLRVALPLPLLRRLLSTHVHSRAASSTPRSPLASTIHLSIHRSIYNVSGRTPPGSTLSPLSLASRLSTQAGVLSDENASSTTATNIQAEASTNPDTGQQTRRAEPDSGLRHGQNSTKKKKAARRKEGKRVDTLGNHTKPLACD